MPAPLPLSPPPHRPSACRSVMSGLAYTLLVASLIQDRSRRWRPQREAPGTGPSCWLRGPRGEGVEARACKKRSTRPHRNLCNSNQTPSRIADHGLPVFLHPLRLPSEGPAPPHPPAASRHRSVSTPLPVYLPAAAPTCPPPCPCPLCARGTCCRWRPARP